MDLLVLPLLGTLECLQPPEGMELLFLSTSVLCELTLCGLSERRRW